MTSFYITAVTPYAKKAVTLNLFQGLVVVFPVVIPEGFYRGSPPYSCSQAVGIPDYNFRE